MKESNRKNELIQALEKVLELYTKVIITSGRKIIIYGTDEGRNHIYDFNGKKNHWYVQCLLKKVKDDEIVFNKQKIIDEWCSGFFRITLEGWEIYL